jgi:hypothetical protein
MENWSTSGISEGTTEIIPASGQTDIAKFKYDVDLRDEYGHGGGVPYREVTFSTTSPITADLTFFWDYWYWHAWAGVTGKLWVFTGSNQVQLVNHSGGGPLEYSGTHTIHVNAGESFGFKMGGSNGDWASYLFGVLTISEVKVEAQIDIKPGSDPNSINTKSRGVIPVAILGSSKLDVESIDYTTIELHFGPELGVGGATPAHDINSEEVFMDHIADVNGDLIPDLVVHFPVQDAGFTAGDETGYLWGETNGVSIYGSDAVNIVK